MKKETISATITVLLTFFFVSSAYMIQILVLKSLDLSENSYSNALFIYFNASGILGMLAFSPVSKRFPKLLTSIPALTLQGLIAVVTMICSLTVRQPVVSVLTFCVFMFISLYILVFTFYNTMRYIPRNKWMWCISIGYSGGIALNSLIMLLPFSFELLVYIATAFHIAAIATVFIILSQYSKKETKAQPEPAEHIRIKRSDLLMLLLFALLTVLLHGINTTIKTQYVYSEPLHLMTLYRLFRIPGLLLAALIASKARRLLFFLATVAQVFAFLELSLFRNPGTIGIASMLSYFLSGFFIFYLVIAFINYSHIAKHPALFAGMGELFLRLGDMLSYLLLGTFILKTSLVDITVVSVLFVLLLLVSYTVHNRFYSRIPQNMFDNDILELQLEKFKKRYGLTEREHDIALLAAKGVTTPELAKSLYISEATVKFHLSSIYRKTGIKHRNQLLSHIMMDQ